MNCSEKINKYIDEHTEDMLRDLKGLMQINSAAQLGADSLPFGKGSVQALEYIRKLAENIGMQTENFENYVVTADFGSGAPTLGILAHVDVVPQGEGWTKPCFDLTLENGRVYGRGAIDDKGPAVASLYAVKAIKELGIPLKSSVRYIFGGGEELGCEDIEYYSSKNKLPECVITPDGEFPIVNAEKGMAHITAKKSFTEGSAVNAKITCKGAVNAVPAKAQAVLCGCSAGDVYKAIEAAKTSAEFTVSESGGVVEIISHGKSAHGSRPQLGVNALTALVKVLGILGIKECAVLSGLFPFEETDGESLGINFSDEVSGSTTLAFTVCEMNEDGCEISLDCRFPVSRTVNEVVGGIEKVLSASGYEITHKQTMEAHHVDENTPFIDALKRAYEKVTGEKARCVCETGVTYAHTMPQGVAFGATEQGKDCNMHSADEYIEIKQLKKVAEIYANAIIEICKTEGNI